MHHSLSKLSLALICAGALSACSTVAPSRHDFQSDATNDQLAAESTLQTASQTSITTEADAAVNTPSLRLTDLMIDSQLSDLIELALKANPSLQKSRLSLEASQWTLRQTSASQKPTASASLSAKEAKDSDTQYSAGVSISWELDLWRKLADSTEAANVSLAADTLTHQAAQASLTANVMKRWLAIISARHAEQIQTQRLALLEKNETLIVNRYRSGLGTLDGLDSARTQTSQARATLAQYSQTLEVNERALAILLGQNTLPSKITAAEYPSVQLPLKSLPDMDLNQRPDVQAAFLAIKAADLNADAAFKNRLPSLSLTAALSDSGASLGEALFVSPVWSLLGQLTAPLYQGGKLKAQSEVANIAVAQRYQDYRDTLLTAVNEIENSVGEEKVLDAQIEHINSAIVTAKSTLNLTERQYRTGLLALSDLISAQQTLFDLQAQLDDLIYQQLTNRIDLGLALGLGVTAA